MERHVVLCAFFSGGTINLLGEWHNLSCRKVKEHLRNITRSTSNIVERKNSRDIRCKNMVVICNNHLLTPRVASKRGRSCAVVFQYDVQLNFRELEIAFVSREKDKNYCQGSCPIPAHCKHQPSVQHVCLYDANSCGVSLERGSA